MAKYHVNNDEYEDGIITFKSVHCLCSLDLKTDPTGSIIATSYVK